MNSVMTPHMITYTAWAMLIVGTPVALVVLWLVADRWMKLAEARDPEGFRRKLANYNRGLAVVAAGLAYQEYRHRQQERFEHAVERGVERGMDHYGHHDHYDYHVDLDDLHDC